MKKVKLVIVAWPYPNTKSVTACISTSMIFFLGVEQMVFNAMYMEDRKDNVARLFSHSSMCFE